MTKENVICFTDRTITCVKPYFPPLSLDGSTTLLKDKLAHAHANPIIGSDFLPARRASRVFLSCSARPDSAPNLHRRPQRDGTLSSLEHYKQRNSPSTRLAPRVARLERETHGLLTDCRKAARTRSDTIHRFSEKNRHSRNPKEPLPSGRGHCRRRSARNAAAPSESGVSLPYVARETLTSGCNLCIIQTAMDPRCLRRRRC